MFERGPEVARHGARATMLALLVESGLIHPPFTPQHCTTNYHMFYLLAADLTGRAALIRHKRGGRG